jgi:hypothetical protein
MKPMLEEMFRRLGLQIVLAHANDVHETLGFFSTHIKKAW